MKEKTADEMVEKLIENNEYAKELIKKVKEVEIGLDYYIKHSKQLENELKQYESMYENRVEEYFKLKKQVEGGILSERK